MGLRLLLGLIESTLILFLVFVWLRLSQSFSFSKSLPCDVLVLRVVINANLEQLHPLQQFSVPKLLEVTPQSFHLFNVMQVFYAHGSIKFRHTLKTCELFEKGQRDTASLAVATLLDVELDWLDKRLPISIISQLPNRISILADCA